MIRSGLLIVLIWLCLSQITLNQRQYAVKKIKNNNRQSKDLKKISDRNLNQHRNHQQEHQQPNKQQNSPKKSFRDYLSESNSNPEIVISHDDQWSNDVVNNNNWGGDNWNSWSPPSWQTNNNGWQSGGGGNGWNGWWQPDPWKDPYKRLSLVKIKPEIQEVYAADVLIRENRNSNFGKFNFCC